MRSIEEARRRLLKRREDLAGRIIRAEEDLRHEEQPLSADFADQAVQRGNDDVLRGIDAEARGSLRQVNRALERLGRGEYFDCVACGRAIEPARHEAVPEAERCAACAD